MYFFAPYEGKEPYIFVSYAHADSPAVMAVISHMHTRGYRIWYDEGIEVGSEWPECIAEHLSAAHLMLAFVSNAYMKSDNCRREMHYALSKRIKVINIFLEETAMTPGMEMQIGNIFALMKYTMSEKVFLDKLYSAPLLNSESFFAPAEGEAAPEAPTVTDKAQGEKKAQKQEKKKNKAEKKAQKRAKKRVSAGKIVTLVLTAVLLIGALTMGIIGHFLGWNERLIIRYNTPEMALLPSGTAAEFTSAALETVARRYTGIETGAIYVSDLASVTELHITAEGFSFGADSDEMNMLPEGTEIRDLSDLQYFTGLRALHINAQPISSLATLPALPIQTLDVSACRVTTLEGVGKLTKLRELYCEGCPVVDLGDLRQCLDLRALDLTGAVIADYSSLSSLNKLSAVKFSNCTTADIKPVLRHSSLTDITLTACDLRGSFFKSFDKESNISSLAFYDCQLDSTVNLDDFSSLTSLTLINTGANLDWAILRELPALTTVNTDNPAAIPALSNSVTVTKIKNEG